MTVSETTIVDWLVFKGIWALETPATHGVGDFILHCTFEDFRLSAEVYLEAVN